MSDSEEEQFMQADKVEDALDNVAGGDGEDVGEQRKFNMVHIQFQQRTTRKCLTII